MKNSREEANGPIDSKSEIKFESNLNHPIMPYIKFPFKNTQTFKPYEVEVGIQTETESRSRSISPNKHYMNSTISSLRHGLNSKSRDEKCSENNSIYHTEPNTRLIMKSKNSSSIFFFIPL